MTAGAARPAALVTRPREDAEGITRALEALGFAVVLEPLLDIVTARDIAVPVDGVQGFLATSANGVRALAANCPRRDLPLWAVGNATARAAADLGFAQVESAGGDAHSLAGLVARRVDPRKGSLVHAAGSKVAGDLAGELAGLGFHIERVVLYEARTATALSPALIAALDTEALDLALFFSPRTATTFARLIAAANRRHGCQSLTAFALSPAVAGELAGLPWRAVTTAARPDQAALLDAIGQAFPTSRSGNDKP